MNIESCREFIELAQCLNFTEAAGNLNITQPALSKHMLALEKEFGIELLDRGKKGVQLTEGGRILFESAGVIVNEYDKTRNTLEQLKAKGELNFKTQ
ncbi:LysR family transcriptional regulator [Eggerthella lenta]|uniref:LysR family transcriptional regulator n=1 Tax=Eggerthella lenta TaxID=84112 RepID=UPI001EE246B8|nr:LysR family transcriptional regulator [Eggerthella lenta]